MKMVTLSPENRAILTTLFSVIMVFGVTGNYFFFKKSQDNVNNMS